MAETIEAQVAALVARVEEQGVEIASMRRALLSLGSHHPVGGPPGIAGYLAWHEDQMKVYKANLALRQDGPTLAEWVAAGYPKDHYPPAGYAPKDPPAWAQAPAETAQQAPVAETAQQAPTSGTSTLAATTNSSTQESGAAGTTRGLGSSAPGV